MAISAMQLLVSVRNDVEAMLALESGADIIDVKEPDAGPLGFAGIETVMRVKSAVGNRVPVSAALGECTDWLNVDILNCFSTQTFTGLTFVKLGLAGMVAPEHASAGLQNQRSLKLPPPELQGWAEEWCRIRRQLNAATPTGSEAAIRVRSPEWVAVAYADFTRAAAPSVWQVLEAAADTGCSTLLIDTFEKDGSGTLDWLSADELRELRSAAQHRRLRFALAGQLTEDDLPSVRMIDPDIFAVRGAVCDDSDRTATVSGIKVRQLKQAMHNQHR